MANGRRAPIRCVHGCLLDAPLDPCHPRPWQRRADTLINHYAAEHDGQAIVRQLPSVTFHEQALLAILALARTGRDFTIGEAHPMVTAEPANPRTEWENARKEAERRGWIEATGTYQRSVVPTTKGSAVAVWRGTYAATRSGAA